MHDTNGSGAPQQAGFWNALFVQPNGGMRDSNGNTSFQFGLPAMPRPASASNNTTFTSPLSREFIHPQDIATNGNGSGNGHSASPDEAAPRSASAASASVGNNGGNGDKGRKTRKRQQTSCSECHRRKQKCNQVGSGLCSSPAKAIRS